jgi:hypothetical protein
VAQDGEAKCTFVVITSIRWAVFWPKKMTLRWFSVKRPGYDRLFGTCHHGPSPIIMDRREYQGTSPLLGMASSYLPAHQHPPSALIYVCTCMYAVPCVHSPDERRRGGSTAIRPDTRFPLSSDLRKHDLLVRTKSPLFDYEPVPFTVTFLDHFLLLTVNAHFSLLSLHSSFPPGSTL